MDNVGDAAKIVVKNGGEIKAARQIDVANVINSWDEYLGSAQTNINKFTGKKEIDRIFSSDGTRSIRFGKHEMQSLGTSKAHFHYENWVFDPNSNTVTVYNILQRLK